MSRGYVLKIILIISMVLVVTILHFKTARQDVELHSIYQHLYYIPIILAGFWFGFIGGITTSLTITGCYFFYSGNSPVNDLGLYAEMIIYNIVGVVTGFFSFMEKRHKDRLEKTSENLSKAYQKLQSTFEQLKQADRLSVLGQLSAGLAHEIRNPLGSIKGAIDIIDNEFIEENPKREFVNIIKEEIDRLNKLVSEFTSFAKPPDPELRDTNVNDIVDSVTRLVIRQAEQQHVKIHTELDDNLTNVLVDSEQIKQVMINIMINGIQSMPQGGILNVKTEELNDNVLISIEDEGVGIESENLFRIFDPFFTTKDSGTGLGLSISYQLMKKNGGAISAYKNSNKGLTLTLSIPAKIKK